MSDKTPEFVDGLIIKAPNDKAPDFVKCSISFKRKELGNWLRAKEGEWINIDVKVSKAGKWYAEVNNWSPNQEQRQELKKAVEPDFDDDDKIPF